MANSLEDKKRETISLSFLVCGILCLVRFEEIPRQVVFDAFAKLTSKYPKELEGLSFCFIGGDGNRAHCSKLEDILSSLGCWGIVISCGDKMDHIKIEPETRKRIEDKLKTDYTTEIIEKVFQLAEEFSNLITDKSN